MEVQGSFLLSDLLVHFRSDNEFTQLVCIIGRFVEDDSLEMKRGPEPASGEGFKPVSSKCCC